MEQFHPAPDWTNSPHMRDAEGYALRTRSFICTLPAGLDNCVALPFGESAEELADHVAAAAIRAIILLHYNAGATPQQRDRAIQAITTRGTVGSVLANRIYRD